MTDREQLHRDGYVLLRQAIPAQWLGELCAVFEASVMPSEQWPVPRGIGWRHALLDVEPKVQAVCRLPRVLAAVGELIGEGFFLSQGEGRDRKSVGAAGRWRSSGIAPGSVGAAAWRHRQRPGVSRRLRLR